MRRGVFVTGCLVVVPLVFGVACGGGGGNDGPTGPGGGLVTETLSGTTRGSSSSCNGFGHTFQAQEGQIAVTLVSSSGEASLGVQVCGDGAQSHQTDCSINLGPIGVGQTRTGSRLLGARQTLVIQPCGGGGPEHPEVTVTFTATVTYTR